MPSRCPILRLSLLAATLAVSPGRAQESTNAFYFVQISDSHFGSLDHEQRMRRIVERINGLPFPVECVIHTGDVFSDSVLRPEVVATATSVLSLLRAPLHVVPGNHDILGKNPLATLCAYTNAMGPLCSRAEYGGVVFLFVDAEPLRRSFILPRHDPMAWLERELLDAAGKPVILCHHAPPVEDFYDNALHEGWPAEPRKKWLLLLRAANVKAVLTGHFHRDELHWIGPVPLYAAAPVAGFWGRQGSFRLYEYRDGRLGYRTVYLED